MLGSGEDMQDSPGSESAKDRVWKLFRICIYRLQRRNLLEIPLRPFSAFRTCSLNEAVYKCSEYVCFFPLLRRLNQGCSALMHLSCGFGKGFEDGIESK